MVILKLLLFAVVVGVSSQSYPHFEFRGDVLVNNSFIVRGQPVNIGEGYNDSLHCVTDNSECCSNGQGDWYDERGRQVQQGPDGEGDLYVTRGDGVVYLNRRRGGSSGMWRCDIPDSNGVNQSIYIYLGTPETGELTSPAMYFTLDSEANEDPPEFTLTCQSKGGPVTEVVWRRNGVTVEEDSNHTTSQIIVDTSSNTVYNNTLRVRGRETTVTYRCTVSSNRHEYVPGSLLRRSAQMFVRVAMEPTSVSATYKTPTSISLEWTFASAPIYDYSYVVYYESGGESHSVSFADKRRSRDNSHLSTGLPVGGIHTIYLVALVDLPSPVAVIPVAAESPEVVVSGEGSGVVGTSYTLTCRVSLPSGVEPDSLDVQWLGPSTDEQTVDTTDNRELTSQLSLDQLSLAHGGDYTCTASYTVDGGTTVTTSDTAKVIPIIAPPSVMLRISEDTILVGEDVVVYCDIDLIGVVRGRDVAVEVTWFQEGVPVRPDSRLTISGATGDAYLGSTVRQCHGPVESVPHILLSRDICSTVWH
ncbi:hypothetical protein GBAR_LOCUS10262 [Geodia barretti]|uniref:Ig-like domain-containing protein n=1 Tax=Geodia barretti TaxID=519541 RepID=A0AA35WGT5_GEOBA|nr:hypothetical protein GBAR_LOCUS10262 [Geodia barretti]